MRREIEVLPGAVMTDRDGNRMGESDTTIQLDQETRDTLPTPTGCVPVWSLVQDRPLLCLCFK